MKFDELEAKILNFYYDHVSLKPDDNPHMIAGVDITDALDKAFVIVDQHAGPYCKGPLVYHRFRECPSLAAFMREGTEYANGKMDPKWNPDAQDRPPTALSTGQLISGKSVPNESNVNKNVRFPRSGAPARVPHARLATLPAKQAHPAQGGSR